MKLPFRGAVDEPNRRLTSTPRTNHSHRTARCQMRPDSSITFGTTV
jgi:hypothetical protein